jgi:hypothetical protein
MNWTELLFETLIHALMISAFVFMMMVIVEYVNVRLKGRLINRVGRRPLVQSTLGGVLGAAPGCLGPFTNVTLYQHGILSFGALVCGMIATSGDEAFVMLSLFPGTFMVLTGILFAVGLITGLIIDAVRRRRFRCEGEECQDLVYHGEAKEAAISIAAQLRKNFSRGNMARWAVLVCLAVFFLLVCKGIVGPHGHDEGQVMGHGGWIRIALIVVTAMAIITTLISSDHFVTEHIINHVVKKHLASIFLWIFGTLLVLRVAGQFFDIGSFVQANRWWMLVVACLIGIIPQSGPHLIFVTLFAQGALPFSILLGSSIVQDGHGMLPLLAFDRKEFLLVKAINLAVGLVVAAGAMALGY